MMGPFKKWPAGLVIIKCKKITARLIHATDVIDNPRKAGKASDIGSLF
jgi:hypothetical protein